MHLHRAQFTIRGLMIAVVFVAGLLALPGGLLAIAAVLSLPCLAFFTARRLLLRGHRRLAGFCFWVPAGLANVLIAALCISPELGILFLMLLGYVVILMPAIAAFGLVWVLLVTPKSMVLVENGIGRQVKSFRSKELH